MPKSDPSRADIELIARLAQDGYEVSRGQLDRWRQRGLLPRPTVERLGSRGSRAHHPPGLSEAVKVLASEARRGRPWQMLALIMLATGTSPEPDGLRGALHWAFQGILDGPPEPGPGAAGSGAATEGFSDRSGAVSESGHEAVRHLQLRIATDLRAAGLPADEADRLLLLTLQERYDETAAYGEDDVQALAAYKELALRGLTGGDRHFAGRLELRTWRVADVEGWRRLVDAATDDDLRRAMRRYRTVLDALYGHLSAEERWALPWFRELTTHAVQLLAVLSVSIGDARRR